MKKRKKNCNTFLKVFTVTFDQCNGYHLLNGSVFLLLNFVGRSTKLTSGGMKCVLLEFIFEKSKCAHSTHIPHYLSAEIKCALVLVHRLQASILQ